MGHRGHIAVGDTRTSQVGRCNEAGLRVMLAWATTVPYVYLLSLVKLDGSFSRQFLLGSAVALTVMAYDHRPERTSFPVIAWAVSPVPLGTAFHIGVIASLLTLGLAAFAESSRRRGDDSKRVTALAALAAAPPLLAASPSIGWLGVSLAIGHVWLAASAFGLSPDSETQRQARTTGNIVPLLALVVILLFSDVVKPAVAIVGVAASMSFALTRPSGVRVRNRLTRFSEILTRPVDTAVTRCASGCVRPALAVSRRIVDPLHRVVAPTWWIGIAPLALAMWIDDFRSDDPFNLEWIALRGIHLAAAITITIIAWPVTARLLPGWRRSARAVTEVDVEPDDDRRCSPAGPHDRRVAPTRGSDLLLVGAVALMVAIVQMRWIWTYRGLGNFDLDELSFYGAALRFEGSGSSELGRSFGPLMPMLSAIPMRFGSRDAQLAIAIQPVLAFALALAATGVARRLVSRSWATICGVVVVLLPATLSATQMYLPSLGAAAALTATVWVVLSSDHGNRRRVWLVCPFLLAVPLFRPMMLIAFPAVIFASIWFARGSIRGAQRLSSSFALCCVVVAQYFLSAGRPAITYVAGGLTTTGVQSYNVVQRTGYRLAEIGDGLGRPVLVVTVIQVFLVALMTIRRKAGPSRVMPLDQSQLLVATITLLTWVGFLAGGYYGGLGFWDYPLLPLFIVLAISVTARSPIQRVALSCWVPLMGWLLYLASTVTWLTPASAPGASWGLGRYEMAVFQSKNGADQRFVADDARTMIIEATSQWRVASEQIARTVSAIDDERSGPLEFVHLGGVNYWPESLLVATQRAGIDSIRYAGKAPDGSSPGGLDSTPGTTERVLLIPRLALRPGRHPSHRTADELAIARRNSFYLASHDLERKAAVAGWQPVQSVPLPLGDRMLIYRAPTGTN